MSSDETHVVTFGVGKELFALPVARVQEILDARPISRLPNAPAHLMGVIDVRGGSVAVVDLRGILGLPEAGDTDETRIIVLRFEHRGKPRTVALRTDRVTEVTELDDGRLDNLAEAEMLNWDERIVEGIGRRNGAFVTVLSLERLFDSTPAALEPLGEALAPCGVAP